MPKVVYAPKPGGTHYSPSLKPGTVLQVTGHEAERLIATGAFEAFDAKAVASSPAPAPEPATEPAPEPSESPAKGRKGTK